MVISDVITLSVVYQKNRDKHDGYILHWKHKRSYINAV